MGYSDLTSLLLYLQRQCHLVTFHGPVVAGDLRQDSAPMVHQQLLGLLTGDAQAMQPATYGFDQLTVLQPGEATGHLIGGCLSLVVCTIGTPWQPQTQDAILFLEDRGERLYAVDRMLTHLRLSGALDGVRGIVFGTLEPVPADRKRDYGMAEVIGDVLADLDIPILCDFPAGHASHPLTLPFGTQVAIRDGQLILCESPVAG